MSFIYGSCNIETISPTLLKKTREYLGEKSVVYMNKPIESVEVSGDRKYFFFTGKALVLKNGRILIPSKSAIYLGDSWSKS